MGSFSLFHWLVVLVFLGNIAMIVHIATSSRSRGGKKIGFLLAQLMIPFLPYLIWLGVRDPETAETTETVGSQSNHNNLVSRSSTPANSVITSTYKKVEAPVIDEDLMYSQIAQEIESGAVNKGLWTRVYAQSSGDESKTKVLYIQERAKQMMAEKLKNIELLETNLTNSKLELDQARESFLAGRSVTQRQVGLLAQASKVDPSLISVRDKVRGRTLLHWCYEFALEDGINTLLQAGADDNAPDGNGNIPSQLKKVVAKG